MTEPDKGKPRGGNQDTSWWDLYSIAYKIRGIGYLVENQKAEPFLPTDFDVVAEGLGRLIGELGETLFDRVSQLEALTLAELKRLSRQNEG